MQITALLIIVIILAQFAKPNNPKYYRIAVGSIFGIAYFCLWMFIRYYAQIFEWNNTYTNTALITLGVCAALLCSLPFINRINQFGSLILLAVFLVSVFITYSLEHEIKYYIADMAGYFDGKNPIIKNRESAHESQWFEFKQGGYGVQIPEGWSRSLHKSSNSLYFSLFKDGHKLAEFRPKCLHQLKLALPEILLNLTKEIGTDGQLKHEKQCFHWEENYAACLIKSNGIRGKQLTSRWRWFAVNPTLQHGLELDFVVYSMRPAIFNDIINITSSVDTIKIPEPRPACLTPAEWM